jgi:thiol:disulfide interchange protein
MRFLIFALALFASPFLKAQESTISQTIVTDTIIIYDTVLVEFFQLTYDTVTVYDTVLVQNEKAEYVIPVSDSGLAFYQVDWETANEMASQHSKPFFIYFKAVWCGPCKVMEKMVFKNPEVKSYAEQNYIPILMDVDDFDGLETASKFAVDLLPEVLFFDAYGNLNGRYRGVISAESFVELLIEYEAVE